MEDIKRKPRKKVFTALCEERFTEARGLNISAYHPDGLDKTVEIRINGTDYLMDGRKTARRINKGFEIPVRNLQELVTMRDMLNVAIEKIDTLGVGFLEDAPPKEEIVKKSYTSPIVKVEDYETKTVAELKKECEKRSIDLPNKCKKQVIIDALLNDDAISATYKQQYNEIPAQEADWSNM